MRDAVGDDERRPALHRDRLDELRQLGRHRAAPVGDVVPHRVGRALADLATRVEQVDSGHAGLRGERHEHGIVRLHGRDAVLGDAQLDDRPALRRLVGEAGEQRRLRELALADVVNRRAARSPGGCRP